MNIKITTLLLLIIFSSFGYSQSEKIKIKTDHLKEANYLQMDDFYLTHHLYIDLFLRENLFPEASTQDISAVLQAIKKYVSSENKLDIEIVIPGLGKSGNTKLLDYTINLFKTNKN